MVLSNIAHTFGDWPDDRAVFGALTLYFAGCDLACKGCHNSRLKTKPAGAQELAPREVLALVEARRADFPDQALYVVLSGGDPLSADNAPETLELLAGLKDAAARVTVYTGLDRRSVERLAPEPLDYIKCGRYDCRKAQSSGHIDGAFYLASRNQVLLNSRREVVSQNGVYRYR